jgi:hypothetical protein
VKRRRVKVGQVWHTKHGYRRVVWVGSALDPRVLERPVRRFVRYSTKYTTARTCLAETFQRWIVTSGARSAQRKRRRTLTVSGIS